MECLTFWFNEGRLLCSFILFYEYNEGRNILELFEAVPTFFPFRIDHSSKDWIINAMWKSISECFPWNIHPNIKGNITLIDLDLSLYSIKLLD